MDVWHSGNSDALSSNKTGNEPIESQAHLLASIET